MSITSPPWEQTHHKQPWSSSGCQCVFVLAACREYSRYNHCESWVGCRAPRWEQLDRRRPKMASKINWHSRWFDQTRCILIRARLQWFEGFSSTCNAVSVGFTVVRVTQHLLVSSLVYHSEPAPSFFLPPLLCSAGRHLLLFSSAAAWILNLFISLLCDRDSGNLLSHPLLSPCIH